MPTVKLTKTAIEKLPAPHPNGKQQSRHVGQPLPIRRLLLG
jgi:hypothetical protein